MKQLLKFIAMVVECLPKFTSQDMQYWIENPRELRVALFQALFPSVRLKIWKTIQLNPFYFRGEQFCKSMKELNYYIVVQAEDMMKQSGFWVSNKRTEIDLVKISVGSLGFDEGATLKMIYRRASLLGLELLPPDVGPQLRLQYQDQPLGENLRMGMKEIQGDDDYSHIFGVCRRHNDVSLEAYFNGTKDILSPSHLFVFELPRSK
jgi:hypothetical protein